MAGRHWTRVVTASLRTLQSSLSLATRRTIPQLSSRHQGLSTQPPSQNVQQTDSPLEFAPNNESPEANKTPVVVDKLYKSLELEVVAYEPSILDSYQWFVLTSATYLGLNVGKCWSPQKSDKDRFNILKSAFVHKKHQVHYEFRTYHKFFTFHHVTESTALTFLEYVQRNLPEGCGLKVTKVEVQRMPDHFKRTD